MSAITIYSAVLCLTAWAVFCEAQTPVGKALTAGETRQKIPVSGTTQFYYTHSTAGPLTISVFPCHGIISYELFDHTGITSLFRQESTSEETPIGPSAKKFGTHGIGQGSTTRSWTAQSAEIGRYILKFNNSVPDASKNLPDAVGEVDIFIGSSDPFPKLPTTGKKGQVHLNVTVRGSLRDVTLYWDPVTAPASGVQYCAFYHAETSHSIFDVHSSHCGHILNETHAKFLTKTVPCVTGKTQVTISNLNNSLFEFDLVAKATVGGEVRQTAYLGTILEAASTAVPLSLSMGMVLITTILPALCQQV